MYLAEFDPLQRLVKITVAGDATVDEVIAARESLRAVLKVFNLGSGCWLISAHWFRCRLA